MAVWDLVDNALDASDERTGRLEIEAHRLFSRTSSRRPVTGLVFLNTCSKPIKDITEILKPYNSSKTNSQSLIGENGVGVKQACATLSDLSFVFTKNGTMISLGILAKDLMQPDGVYFPTATFRMALENINRMEDDTVAKLHEILLQCHPAVRKVLHTYGKLDDGDCLTDYDSTEDAMENRAIQRLAHQVCSLYTTAPWQNYNYVFCLIMEDLLQGGSSAKGPAHRLGTRAATTESPYEQRKGRVVSLMEEIEAEAPLHYLHVQESFQFIVDGGPVNFSYWQRRLVELSRFSVLIDTQAVSEKDNTPLDLEAEAEQLNASPSSTKYFVDVFVGFDTLQEAHPTEKGHALLCVHSRKAGRLIKRYKDCRGYLGLGNSGTDFCQGLTIILDDRDGRLPLNPTKQDMAFGEREFGQAHEHNVKNWVAAAAKLYYKKHLDESHGKKGVLGDRVRAMEGHAFSLVEQGSTFDSKPMSECRLIQYRQLHPKFHGTGIFRFDPKTCKVLDTDIGDCRMRIPPTPPPVAAPLPVKKTPTRVPGLMESPVPRKRKARDVVDLADSEPEFQVEHVPSHPASLDSSARVSRACPASMDSSSRAANANQEIEPLSNKYASAKRAIHALMNQNNALKNKNAELQVKADRLTIEIEHIEMSSKRKSAVLATENARLKSANGELKPMAAHTNDPDVLTTENARLRNQVSELTDQDRRRTKEVDFMAAQKKELRRKNDALTTAHAALSEEKEELELANMRLVGELEQYKNKRVRSSLLEDGEAIV
jgi:hypothetical protein